MNVLAHTWVTCSGQDDLIWQRECGDFITEREVSSERNLILSGFTEGGVEAERGRGHPIVRGRKGPVAGPVEESEGVAWCVNYMYISCHGAMQLSIVAVSIHMHMAPNPPVV